jgi:hypothetical protein
MLYRYERIDVFLDVQMFDSNFGLSASVNVSHLLHTHP